MANGGQAGDTREVRSYNCKLVRRISERQLWKLGKGESKMVALGGAGAHERQHGLEKTFVLPRLCEKGRTLRDKRQREGGGDVLRGCGHWKNC